MYLHESCFLVFILFSGFLFLFFFYVELKPLKNKKVVKKEHFKNKTKYSLFLNTKKPKFARLVVANLLQYPSTKEYLHRYLKHCKTAIRGIYSWIKISGFRRNDAAISLLSINPRKSWQTFLT